MYQMKIFYSNHKSKRKKNKAEKQNAKTSYYASS